MSDTVIKSASMYRPDSELVDVNSATDVRMYWFLCDNSGFNPAVALHVETALLLQNSICILGDDEK